LLTLLLRWRPNAFVKYYDVTDNWTLEVDIVLSMISKKICYYSGLKIRFRLKALAHFFVKDTWQHFKVKIIIKISSQIKASTQRRLNVLLTLKMTQNLKEVYLHIVLQLWKSRNAFFRSKYLFLDRALPLNTHGITSCVKMASLRLLQSILCY